MQIQRVYFWAFIILSFVLGWTTSYYFSQPAHLSSKDKSSYVATSVVKGEVPDYVLETMEYVLEYGEAPAGYVGGRTFYNREKQLPMNDESGSKIQYREWDVLPKVKGKNRGAERLVTSQDGKAYYTKDHYRTFKQIN